MTRVRARKDATLAERLALHSIVAPSGCWIWTGAVTKGSGADFYGRIFVDGTTRYAHRVSYEVHVGPIPDGCEIDHLCRRTRCIRPLHLEAVTPSINVRRGTSPGARAARRTSCSNGHPFEEHGVTRLGRRICRLCRTRYNREIQRLWPDEIAARKAAGLPLVDLAAIFAEDAA